MLALATVPLLTGAGIGQGIAAGMFSRDAVGLRHGDRLRSPGGTLTVSLQWLDDNSGETFPGILRVQSGSRTMERRFTFALDAEVLWSPNRDRFAVTGSAQGANGQYRTGVVTVSPSGLKWFDPTPLVEAAFGHRARCDWPETPNIGAIGWVSQTRLLLAAEIINHSNCASAGTFAAYEVDVVSQRIVRNYDQIEVERRWNGLLGSELGGRRNQR